MNPNELLQRLGTGELAPEETDALLRELSAAYHIDEAAAASRDVGRIVEKVRALLHSQKDGQHQEEEN